MKRYLLIQFLSIVIYSILSGNTNIIHTDTTKDSTPLLSKPFTNKFGFELSTGIQGIFSYYEVGLCFPNLIRKNFYMDFKARYMSSLTWATFKDEHGDVYSVHPTVVAGIVSFGGFSPIFHNNLKAYGGCDIMVGYSFTPWEDLIYKTGNLFGENMTYGFFGFFGFELFTSDRIAYFIDAGGGYKMMAGDKENPYLIAASWLGSGCGIRMGIKFYK
ncbi:hypothetical protein ACFL6D_01060 [Spirochaetota bacterium]